MQPLVVASDRAAWSVPPEHLARPARDELRDLERRDCALLLDGYLRILARQEAACRCVLGRVAGTFLRLKGHRRLAFARIGDYTRERLGLSARELQSAARIAMKLDALPALARALETGAISWTHARILVDVATLENETAWVARARELTVRALVRRIRAGGTPVVNPAACSGARTDRDGPDAQVGSGRGHESALAGRDHDDARAVTTPEVDHANAVDRANAATDGDEDDGSTLDGEPAVRVRIGCPRRVRALWRATVELARRMAGEPLPVWQACEAIAAEGLTSSAARDNASDDGRGCSFAMPRSLPNGGGADGETDAEDAERRAEAFSFVDWESIEAAVPESVAAFADDLDALDAFALDARMRAVLAAMHRVHWQTGRLLRLVFDLRLYRWLGFRTTEQYVKERLGIGIRTAQTLVAVERVTWRAPELAAAYERGTISPLRALIIGPVLSEAHAAAWLMRAREVTVRRLSDEVTWALNHHDVRPLCEPVAPPPPGRLVMPSNAQMRARFGDETPEVVISVPAPVSVAALFEAAIAAFTQVGEPRWRGFERLLENVQAEWNARPPHRDPIFARDGWRCAVPTCSSRRNLHDHHIVFRSHCGDNARENRVAICAAHHQHGLHGGGYIRAWGKAPDGIRWELGTRPNASPLLTLIGERYVSDS